jgi:hypothetical protein
MLKQLSQRKGAAVDPIIEAEMAARDQLEGCRGQHRLGEAPPRDACLIGTDFPVGIESTLRESAAPSSCQA